MFVHVLLLALTQLLTLAATEYVVYNGKTLEGSEGVCPGDQQTGTVQDEIDTEVRGVVRDRMLPRIPSFLPSRPANSCSEISERHPGLPSYYYWVIIHNSMQYKSIVTWTECVAAATLEDGLM